MKGFVFIAVVLYDQLWGRIWKAEH